MMSAECDPNSLILYFNIATFGENFPCSMFLFCFVLFCELKKKITTTQAYVKHNL